MSDTLAYIIIGLLAACLICLVITIRQQAVMGRSLRRVRQMQQRYYWTEVRDDIE